MRSVFRLLALLSELLISDSCHVMSSSLSAAIEQSQKYLENLCADSEYFHFPSPSTSIRSLGFYFHLYLLQGDAAGVLAVFITAARLARSGLRNNESFLDFRANYRVMRLMSSSGTRRKRNSDQLE